MRGAAKRYHLAPAARADLESIWLYTAERWSPDQADRYHNLLIDGIASLLRNPYRGLAADRIRRGYRRLNSRSHAIFYRISGDTIEVIRILHASMDFGRHL